MITDVESLLKTVKKLNTYSPKTWDGDIISDDLAVKIANIIIDEVYDEAHNNNDTKRANNLVDIQKELNKDA